MPDQHSIYRKSGNCWQWMVWKQIFMSEINQLEYIFRKSWKSINNKKETVKVLHLEEENNSVVFYIRDSTVPGSGLVNSALSSLSLFFSVAALRHSYLSRQNSSFPPDETCCDYCSPCSKQLVVGFPTLDLHSWYHLLPFSRQKTTLRLCSSLTLWQRKCNHEK